MTSFEPRRSGDPHARGLVVASGSGQLAIHGQDRLLVVDDLGLYGVFDGVGEFRESGRAAACAAGSVRARCSAPAGVHAAQALPAVVEGLQDAHAAIIARRWGATTAVVVRLAGDGVAVAAVGDSRLYVAAGGGRLVQWTTDEGVGHRVDNWLGESWPLPRARIAQAGVIALDLPLTLVLVTDGVTGDLPDEWLSPADLEAALDGRGEQAAAEQLIAIARKHDDRTAVVVRIRRAEEREAQPRTAPGPG